VNRQAALRVGVCVQNDLPELSWIRAEIGLVVDALLGTGLKSDLRSPLSTWVDAVNTLELPVVAVDLPTGLCGDTGRVHGTAIQADITVCIGRAKLGCFLEPGADFAGEVVLANIGLLGNVDPSAEIVCGGWVAEHLPKRSKSSHKNSHGHLGVIAGSLERAGAAVLTCNAALAAGCGLVTLIIHPDAVPRLGQLGPEIMVLPSEDLAHADLTELSALAVGPGVGTDDASRASLLALWKSAEKPAVFDADGLTALEGHFEQSLFSRCITPHPGEASRLLGRTSGDVQSDRLGVVRALAKIAPTLLKGRNTLISNGGAAPVRINPTGTSALATAGTGDVLTGMVGAFLAQGIAPFEALTMAAFLHGYAAERVARSHFAAGELNLVLGEAMANVADRDPVLSARSLVSA
jgi:NAD(P)H-hydrate epimerase